MPISRRPLVADPSSALESASPAAGVPEGAAQVDARLLAALDTDPQWAWAAFVDRHADFVLQVLEGLGPDPDEVMDRFVFVCEKLAEANFARLRSIRFVDDALGIRPWLRQVTQRLAVDWLWNRHGRRRVAQPVLRLSLRDQEVFRLHFWQGLSAHEIHQSLGSRDGTALRLVDVFDSLERVLAALGSKRIWRLVADRARARPIALDAQPGDSLAARSANPEQQVLAKETAEELERALAHLDARERLVLRLRIEDDMARAEIAELLGSSAREISVTLKRALRKLRIAYSHLREVDRRPEAAR